jgi:hypothetical protein
MIPALAVISLILTSLLIIAFLKLQRLNKTLATVRQEAEATRKHYEGEASRIHTEAVGAISNAQQLVDQQLADLKEEGERIRQHYESEALKSQEAAEALVSKTLAELEPLRKFESLAQTEAEIRSVLAEAVADATALRKDAANLLEQSRTAAGEERAAAIRKVREIGEEAQVLLLQARTDATRILEEANRRAEQIGGDAYSALRDKQSLERAVQALRNIIEGYGDKYLIPTRSILDDLAAEFGHTAAGESLRVSRELTRRMVETGQAGACDYVEANRRETAIRFVIDAFNGRVDGILSRTKHDNYGTLEQEIRDAFNLVNLNGNAFRDARIQSSFLDARLAELRWGGVVQELRLKEREEQRRIQEQMREEEKVRREVERALRDSAKEQEIIRQAMAKAQEQVQHATQEQKAKYELQLQELAEKLKTAEEKNQRALSMAQQTKLGHVYIISNIGSFGEHVFKIGMTRRLIPQDRIDELGDSSVPFEFDVHAFIRCDDAPALEAKLHKHFVMAQINKVNHRKEFFRVDLKHIKDEIEKLGIVAQWTLTSEAEEYRQTLTIEEAIKKNPSMREAWIKRQFQLEVLDQQADEILTETVTEPTATPLN